MFSPPCVQEARYFGIRLSFSSDKVRSIQRFSLLLKRNALCLRTLWSRFGPTWTKWVQLPLSQSFAQCQTFLTRCLVNLRLEEPHQTSLAKSSKHLYLFGMTFFYALTERNCMTLRENEFYFSLHLLHFLTLLTQHTPNTKPKIAGYAKKAMNFL